MTLTRICISYEQIVKCAASGSDRTGILGGPFSGRVEVAGLIKTFWHQRHSVREADKVLTSMLTLRDAVAPNAAFTRKPLSVGNHGRAEDNVCTSLKWEGQVDMSILILNRALDPALRRLENESAFEIRE